MQPIIIRRATIDDFKQVQQLELALFLHEAQKDQLINTNWPLEDAGEAFIRRMITANESICLVAETDGRLIGFLNGALLYMDQIRPIKRAQLVNIFVEEQYRNHQAGTKLVDKFVQWCKEKQVQRIQVTAQVSNVAGIRFYEQSGFHRHMVQFEKELKI